LAIRATVQVVHPQIGERIYDGACGSAGFLCESFEYMKSKKDLTTKDLKTLQERTFYGKEKKSLAFVIAIMNMVLHGIDAPNVIHTNTLTENLAEIQEKNRFDVVLANPPFGGHERKEVQQNFPTRAKLLQGLAEKGFGRDQMAEMQRIIDASKSDLFDVLAYVAYALPPLTRDERAIRAKAAIRTHFNSKLQAFLEFVLAHYVSEGVEELDREKLKPLLDLRYHDSIADAVADLGKPEEIGIVFAGFQKYLYQPTT